MKSNLFPPSSYCYADKEAVSYSSFGAAVTEVEVDVLTGERQVLRADILYDCGYSLNPALDMGQVEGAFVQVRAHLEGLGR